MMKRIAALVEQHAEGTAFLWLLRDRSVRAPHISLSALAHLDGRIEAHIDGLRVAGDDGWHICLQALAHEEPGEVFSAAIMALESGKGDRIQAVLEAAGSKPELLRAIVSALGWMPAEQVEPFIRQLTASESPTLRRIGVAAAAAHRIDPGQILEQSITNADDPQLTARALRAAGELGLPRLLPFIRPYLDDEIDDIRFAASWSAALLGESAAVPVLGAFAADGGARAEDACMVGLRRLSGGSAYKAHQELAGRPGLSRLAVAAAGMTGDPALIDWLLAQMQTPALARLAGESFSLITGVDIEHERFEGTRPGGFQSGPTEDADDENVEPDPDEDLPWPDRDKLQDWWYDYRSQFRAGVRHILGNTVTQEWLWDVLRNGLQRQRAAAALELALEAPGPLFEVRAPGFRQRRWLRA